MPQTPLPAHKIRKLLHRYAANNFNKAQTASLLRISRNSATRYIDAFKRSSLTIPELDCLPSAKLVLRLFPKSKHPILSRRKRRLLAHLQAIHSRIEIDGLSALAAWRAEVADQCSYKYSQFASLYAAWRLEHGHGRISTAKRRQITVNPHDFAVLKSWQRSHDRRKWEVALALLSLSSNRTLSEICNKLGRAPRTVEHWYATYQRVGIDAFPLARSRRLSEQAQIVIKDKKERLIKIIHETPKTYGINRASWSLDALSEAYEKMYGERASRSSISEYFIAAGYKFNTASTSE
jgi:transposase